MGENTRIKVFLDHIQNREAVRIGNYSHPYIRLCPVSRLVNTNGGGNTGGEGMEKESLRGLSQADPSAREAALRALRALVVLADPIDLTKMLDVAPGTQVLLGVASMLACSTARCASASCVACSSARPRWRPA